MDQKSQHFIQNRNENSIQYSSFVKTKLGCFIILFLQNSFHFNTFQDLKYRVCFCDRNAY